MKIFDALKQSLSWCAVKYVSDKHTITSMQSVNVCHQNYSEHAKTFALDFVFCHNANVNY